jgi:hypothetical protein
MRIPGLACALLAFACGDIKTVGGGDGGSGDGGTPDARAVGSVSVRLGKFFGDTQPLEGNQVVFVDSSGAVAADLTTDADGAATADGIEAGSTMIIFIATPPAGAPDGSQAAVVFGVEPGDDIHIDGEDAGAAVGNMNITWGDNAANHYDANNGCTRAPSTTDLTTNLSFEEGCLTGGEAQALVRSADGNDVTTGWIGGTVAFAADGTLDLGDTWSTPRPLTVSLSDLPSEAKSVYPRLVPARNNVSFDGVSLPQVLLDQATASFEAPLPRSFVTSNAVRLEFQPNQPGIGGNSLSLRVAADASALDVSVAGELLPWYGWPVLDIATRTFRWSRSSGVAPDAQHLAMFWTEEGGTERLTVFLVPPDVDEVTLPELPSEYEPFMPANAADLGIQIIAGEASELEDYRAARQRGFELAAGNPRLGLEAPSTLRRSYAGEDF